MTTATKKNRLSTDETTTLSAEKLIKLIAFYLPQFHPTPENDRWWGKGFTEWTNVTKAKPLFDGHYQPHLPSDLGFYDLRLPEVRYEQFKLAKEHGIHGFCYHYYWFSGERLLNKPVDDMLADPNSEMPFCLCWANENWTRKWDAADHEILIEQKYLPDDPIKFITDLAPFLSDKRYIRFNGAPIVIVYTPQDIPDPVATTKIWREYCEKIGIGKIHLCAALTHGNMEFKKYGLDSAVEFPPHNIQSCTNISKKLNFKQPFFGNTFDYKEIAETFLSRTYTDRNVFRTVFPSWDNTARTNSRAVAILGGEPNNYSAWLSQTIRNTKNDFPDEQRFVFINAWNEWAEGCHLEPDRMYGMQFLESTKKVVSNPEKTTALTETQAHIYSDTPKKFIADLKNVIRMHLGIKIGDVRNIINKNATIKKLLLPSVRKLKKYFLA